MTERTKCESNPSRGSEDLQASRSSSRIRLNVDLLARLAIAALVVLFLTISVGAEVFAVTQEDCPQGYYGEFIRSEYDASGNTTTFFYRAYQPGSPAHDVSHWMVVLPFCIECSEIVAVNPSDGQCGTDGSTGKYGIKWDYGWNGALTKDFSITFSGYRTEEEPEADEGILLKYGSKYCITPVIVPSCEELTPNPSIDIEKATNGEDADNEPGPYIEVGDTVTWTYEVTNTGNVPLSSINVTDDQGVTPVYQDGDADSDGALDTNETWTYQASGAATLGGYENKGTATGVFYGTTYTDEDYSHYTGFEARITLDPLEAYNGVGDSHTVTATVEVNDGTSWEAKSGVEVTFSLPTNNAAATFVSGTSDTTDTSGEATATITAASPGLVEIHASADIFGNGSYVVSTGGGGQNSADAEKRYIKAKIELTPTPEDDAINKVGQQHEIVATVSVTEDGSIWAPVTGASVTLAIASDGTGSASLDPLNGTTDGSGQFSSQLVASGPGVIRVSGSATISNYGGLSITQPITVWTLDGAPNSENAKKTYVSPSITIEKTVYRGHDNGGSAPGTELVYGESGDAVTYIFTVKNTGDTYLASITISDGDLGIPPASVTKLSGIIPLAPDAIAVYYYETTISQDLINTASVFGNPTDAFGNDLTGIGDVTDEDTAEVDMIVPGINIRKTADPTVIYSGNAVTYTYEVTNNGDDPLTSVTVTDDKLATVTRGADNPGDNDDVLEPGETWVYTATANPTQDVINIGTATGYDSSGTPREASDEAWVDVINPGISTEKSTNGFDADNVPGPSILIGEQITWIYEITNTGDVVLSDVVVSDSIAGVNPVFVGGGDTNGNNRLDTYETWTYEATGIAVVGQYENNGNVTAKDPLEGDVTDDDLSHYFGMNPALTIEKVADKATVSVAGTVINYTITVDNTGNVDLTNVVLTDVFAGGAMLDSGDTNSNDILETTETWIYTASYTVTQSDINEGEDLVNVANVDTDQTDEQQDDATTEVSQNPSISLIKTGTLNDDDGTPGVSVGDTISYSFIVENTGNVTLDNVVLSETVGGVTISALSDIADDGVGVLARGGSEAATGTYTITQTDIDAGQFYNEAKVDATDPNDQLVTDTDDETVDLEQGPAYTIVKTATGIDTAGDGSINNAGEIIDYTIVVENTGNVSLHNVNVADPLLGTLGGPTESGIGDGILAVDETFTYTGSYTVQQSDLDDNGISSNGDADGDGDIDNEATVSSEELQDKTASAEVPIIRSPAISVVKTADPTSVSVAGTTVTYSYTVENAGNVTLNNVTLADDNGTSGDTSDDFSVSLNSTTLAPGETATGISTRVITQEDMDIGSDIINLATAESDKAGPVDDNAKVSMSQEPSILLVKAGTLNDDDGTAGVSAGDTIDYSFTVTNTGNVTLTNVTVTDPDVTVNGGPISLAPGASDTDTFTGTYTITQADIDAGVKDNTATVTGKDPEGQDVTDTDDESVTLPQSPAIDIEKSTNGQDADNPPGPNVVVGDAITWSYVVTNVGNVTLTNIEVTDSDLGSVATIASLAPGGSQALTASGTAVGGQYENTGTATVLFDETTYSDSDDSHYFGSGADLSLTKVVDDARPNEGDTVIYTITLTNDGPNDATGVEVTDVLPDGLSYVSDNGGGAYSSTTNVWTVGGLANGGSVTLAITVTVDAGTGGTTITNTAEVTAADQPDPDSTPNNQDPTEDDQVSVDLTVQSADLVVEKTVDNPTPNEGDTIVYTITITNDGPSDATGVTLDDLLPVGVTYVSDNSAGAYSPFTGVWTIGDLAFEETRTLAITATVHTGTAGTTITNAAEITTSDQPDPDLTNNRDTADMTIAEGGGGGGGSSDPCEGKVIINEVAWSGTIEDSRDEWIELRNLGTIPVDLTGWTIQWRRKNPTTEEEKRWKVVDLSGVILPAGTSACDLVDNPQTVSVTLEKTEIDAVSWRVITEKQQHDESFYILERRHDETISNSQADLIYDISQPYRIELDDAGDVIQLVDNLGEVVDTANAFPFPSDGWPGGDAATHATMERTDPLAADTADNWHTNLGIVIWGEDAARNALIATADAPNSSKLDQLWLDPDAPVAKTRAGARLEVGLEVTKQERRAYGWPWVRVTQPQLVASAGGGGAVEQGAGFTFSGRYSNDVYWLGIDTAKLLPGRYNVWIVYGGGKTVLVPIEILL